MNSKINLKTYVDYQVNGIFSSKIIENGAGGVTIFAFSEGQRLSEHTAPFNAFVQILDGLAQIKVNGVEHELHEGEGIVMPANIPHALLAKKNFKMMLVMIKDK